MQSSPSMQGFRLPDNPDPPMICVQLQIPNEPAHIAAFLGVLYDLTLWNSWQRDAAHRGIAAAQIWKQIWVALVSRPFGCVQPGTAGADSEETLIRQNPDNSCELQTSINGTDWCTFADLSLCLPASPQPGSGSPQPAPGGGNACYNGTLSSSSQWLIPTVVNTGDVLDLQSASGAANDGTFSPWRCQDGLEFFAGTCTGSVVLEPTDPLPTVGHMRLIWNIAGSYFDAMAGPVTVPAGVVNALATLQVNDSSLSDNSGTFQIAVCVTNNQAAPWSSVFDFSINSYVALVAPLYGTWVAGVGWKGVNRDANDLSEVQLHLATAPFTIESAYMEYTTPGQGGANGLVGLETQAGFYGSYITPGAQSHSIYSTISEQAGVTDFYADNNSGTVAGDCYVYKLTISGKGAKPVGWP